jgi:hypothetical protein
MYFGVVVGLVVVGVVVVVLVVMMVEDEWRHCELM